MSVLRAGLAPGVALPPGSSLPRINGGRPRTNEYLFDGISVLRPEPGQVAFFPNIDAIDQFRIESNSPPAEFGRFNGGVVNLTTRSGTNEWHGSAFEFLRHDSLNARNYFAPTGPKPAFRRQQFGGVVGGPIRKDRAFFFGDYQGQRQSIGRTIISTVPTVLQREGVFSEPIGGRVPTIYDPATTSPAAAGGWTRTPFPGNMIPVDRVDAVARALSARYPLPTTTGTANNYRPADIETVNQDQFSGRVDQRMNGDRGQVFARLTRFHETFAGARLFDGRHPARLRGVGRVGPSVRQPSWATSIRRAGAIVNDWTVTGLVTLQSGVPIAVTQATNNNAFAGFGTQRPNLVGDPALPSGERTVIRWFNTDAFAAAPQFTIGTSSRNPVRGPGYRNLDVAVLRRIGLRAGNSVEVRAEVFNATNTPALGPPNGTFGSAAFGTITTAADPRVVQLAVKLVFQRNLVQASASR